MLATFKSKHPLVFWLSIALLLIAPAITTILQFVIIDEFSRTIISDISAPIINLVSVCALIYAAIQSSRVSKQLSIGWSILAFALLSYTVGDVFWGITDLINDSDIFFSIANVAYLLFNPLFFIGISFLPFRKISFYEGLKMTFDLGSVMIAAVLGIWVYIIGPILGTNLQNITQDVWIAAAYPIGDLIIFSALLILIYSRSRKTNLGSILILALGMIVMIITDLFYTHSSTIGTYVSGSRLDLGWILAVVLFGTAGIYQGVVVQHQSEDKILSETSIIKIEKRVSQFLTYLSYFWVMGAYYLLRQYHHSEEIIDSDVLFFGVGVIAVLVIFRQIFALQENDRLFLKLKSALEKVNLHTSELNIANMNLQQEIVKRKHVEKQLSHDALHDGLTGLPNRVLFMDRLVHAVELKKRESKFRYSVLFLDIDNFKAINDGLGHTYGDQALIEISQRLTSCTRSIDTVARLGGDEFIILLEHTLEKNTAVEVANRITGIINQSFIHKHKEVHISCSIGVILDISDYSNPEDILRDVDIALYRAKEKGKSQYEVFDIEMRNQAMSRIELEDDLQNSLINGEMFLVYQPIYSLDQKKLAGFEALVRWHHPLRGLVAPLEFIPFAEESGFIQQLGDWVLHEACSQLIKWHTEYPSLTELTINVNISGKQIRQSDFVDKVKNILKVTGLNPNKLVLEITENSLIENQGIIDELLSNLRKIGVTFSIDDFGTGYSSMGYLKNFSVDSIKIDKSFIDGIVTDKKGYEIVKTIIQMAKKLGIKTVAEGIENDEQLTKLQALTCIFGQGYFLSKPVYVEKIDKILKSASNNK